MVRHRAACDCANPLTAPREDCGALPLMSMKEGVKRLAPRMARYTSARQMASVVSSEAVSERSRLGQEGEEEEVGHRRQQRPAEQADDAHALHQPREEEQLKDDEGDAAHRQEAARLGGAVAQPLLLLRRLEEEAEDLVEYDEHQRDAAVQTRRHQHLLGASSPKRSSPRARQELHSLRLQLRRTHSASPWTPLPSSPAGARGTRGSLAGSGWRRGSRPRQCRWTPSPAADRGTGRTAPPG